MSAKVSQKEIRLQHQCAALMEEIAVWRSKYEHSEKLLSEIAEKGAIRMLNCLMREQPPKDPKAFRKHFLQVWRISK